MQTPKKSTNISSATGRSPVAAAPTPAPMNPASVIGVSSTRSSPELLHDPLGDAERAAPGLVVDEVVDVGAAGDVLAEQDHVRVLGASRSGAPR